MEFITYAVVFIIILVAQVTTAATPMVPAICALVALIPTHLIFRILQGPLDAALPVGLRRLAMVLVVFITAEVIFIALRFSLGDWLHGLTGW